MTKPIIIPPAVMEEMATNGEFLDPSSSGGTLPGSVKIHFKRKKGKGTNYYFIYIYNSYF